MSIKRKLKILYFGTVCNLDFYNQLLKHVSEKPSVAPIVFESALLTGFHSNEAEIEIHSFPMVPTFPKSRLLFFGNRVEKIPSGYWCRWLNTVNIPVMKQISRRMDARKAIKEWRKNNKENRIIFTYSVPPFLVKNVLKYAKKYKIKTVAIIPDLLRDMYINEKKQSIGYWLKSMYIKPALKLQGKYDGYIYLTKEMSDVVAPDKPYIVVEGVADISNVKFPAKEEKAISRAIMYAGMLHEKYGIMNLMDAFEMLSIPDVELWLFGSGTAVEQIKERAKKNNRIKYFGSVEHNKILDFERKATLLVNPRDPQEEFTQYSFPSKTIEYMLSGTPLLTTKLKGIPIEYHKYVFTSESNNANDLACSIKKIFSLSLEELVEFGYNAQQFVVKEKNADKQAAKILGFFEEVINE